MGQTKHVNHGTRAKLLIAVTQGGPLGRSNVGGEDGVNTRQRMLDWDN